MSEQSESTSFGRNFALAIALVFFVLAVYAALTHRGPIEVTLPLLIGGSAFAGWEKARRRARAAR